MLFERAAPFGIFGTQRILFGEAHAIGRVSDDEPRFSGGGDLDETIFHARDGIGKTDLLQVAMRGGDGAWVNIAGE